MNSSFVSYCALAIAIVGSSWSDAVPAEPSAPLERFAPLSPEASREALVLAPGFRAEIVAAEPLVRSPVAIDFDGDGRMFVIEYPEYNDYAATRPHGHGALRVLEDRDGDGRFDTSTILVDGLNGPSGVLCYDGGAFVAAAPELLFIKDTDGDGRADVRRAVLVGFERDHAGEGILNSLRWGPDNRVHVSTGLSGGLIRHADRSNDRPVSVRNMGIALDPRSLAWEVTGGGGQYGMAFDDWGRKFASSNSTPVWQIMYDNRYLARNGAVLGPAAGLPIVPEGKFTQLYRVSPLERWRAVREELREHQLIGAREQGRISGIFTSACGIVVYRGDAFAARYRGDTFTGEVANNLVYHARLEADGEAFKAVRADAGREFLASRDPWFRPVQLANGPDGCLYVVDMYRELIEGADFLPDDMLKQLDPSSGVDRGRIYRIAADGFQRRTNPRLSSATVEALVALVESSNGWHVDTACRLLCERADPSTIEPLRRMAASSLSPQARMRALYLLATFEALKVEDVLATLDAAQPELREHAVLLAERFASDKRVLARLTQMVEDPAVRVRCQLAFSLGYFAQPSATEALVRLATREPADHWICLGVACSSKGRAATILHRLAVDEAFRKLKPGQALLLQLAQQIGAVDDPAETADLLNIINALISTDAALGKNLLRRMLVARPPQAPRLELSGAAEELWSDVLAAALKTAGDPKQSAASRASAVQSLVFLPWSEVRSTFQAALRPDQPEPLQRAVVESITRYHDPGVAELLLGAWPALSPQLRTSAIEALLARAAWIDAFLNAVERGQIAPAEIESSRVQLLQAYPEPTIRERAARLFARSTEGERAEVAAHYRPALSLQGDTSRGREVFRKNCTACHQLEKVGRAIGPDLGAVGDRGLEAVLLNILDPNREIKPKFLVYIVVTKDGQAITGMVSGETATSLTIYQPDGGHRTLLRSEIEELENTGRSFMPEGLEKQIDQRSMADLLAYLTLRK